MTALIGKIEEFREGKEEWLQYIERLEHYFVANDVTTAAKKQAVLLTVIGPDAYKLLRNLVAPAKPGEKSYDELVRCMNEHHNPVPSEIVQRFKFNSRYREEGETVAQYIAALRSLAEFCNYGSSLDDMLRDRLVCGVRNDRIQRSLLAEKSLTLEKALATALSIERAAKNVKDLQATQTHSDRTLNKLSQSQSTVARKPVFSASKKQRPVQKPCYRCGKDNHHSDKCRFKNNTCFNCQKRGHIASVCRSAKSGKPHVKQMSATVDSNSTESDENEADVDMNAPVYSLFGCTTDRPGMKPIKVTMSVDNTDLVMEVDTGAALSLVSEETFKSHWPNADLQKTNLNLRTYTGERVSVLGNFNVEVDYNASMFNLPLLVVKGSGPSLLGRNWLQEIKLNWQQINVLHTTTSVEEVLKTHSAVFKDELGTLKGTTATIYVDKDVRPRFCKARVVPYAMRTLVDNELDRLQAAGIIEPVQFSEWAAPIVPVLKPDKSSVRICGDYKLTVNQVAKLDKYPIPKIEDLFASLAGGRKFTKLDLSQAYQQLILDEESRTYVVINTHRGLFRYTRLPFGVASAPAIFQRTMENILQGIPHVTVYLDDILITGTDDQSHLTTLSTVLARLEQAGLRLKMSKCTFMAPSVVYLGHTIDAQGLHPTADKVNAIRNAPAPTNVTELRAYLGLLTYYGKFLPQLSTTLSALYRLLRKDTRWRWGTEERKAFGASKDLLLSSNLLVHFDPKKDVIVSCDASQYGIGAVLAHRMPDGSEKPIGFASRTLAPAEKKYSQIEKEGLACVFGVTKFHSYIYGRHFTLVTDHKPLLSLFNEERAIPPQASARIQRWALTLAMYEYTLVFKSTMAHGNADALSRLPLPTYPAKVPVPAETVLLMENIDASPLSTTHIRNWTRRDPVLAKILQFVEGGWPPHHKVEEDLKPYTTRSAELSVQDGCLMWGSRVIVPQKGRKRVLQCLHEGHPGMARMKSLARGFAWWPRMDSDIEIEVKGCHNCQQNQPMPPKSELHPWKWPERPWSRLHIDYAGPFLGKMFLIVVDSHSKWMEVFPLNNATTHATIEKLRQAFATHGLPDKVVSDNGTPFTSSEFREFMTKNGILHIRTSPYHPASNGLAERAVRTFKHAMKRMDTGTVETRVSRFLFHYRITPHSSTGVSPAEMLMGRRLRSHLDQLRPDVAQRVIRQQDKQKYHHDKHAKTRVFGIGDTVLVRNFTKSGYLWQPGTITDHAGLVSYKIRLAHNGCEIKRHVDHLRSQECVPHAPHHEPLNLDDDTDGGSSTTVPLPQPPPTGHVIPPATNVQPEPQAPAEPEPQPVPPADRKYPSRIRNAPDRYGFSNT